MNSPINAILIASAMFHKRSFDLSSRMETIDEHIEYTEQKFMYHQFLFFTLNMFV